MQGSDESPDRKGLIIGMMCLCVVMSLAGQFSQHWLTWINSDFESGHSSLDTSYFVFDFEDGSVTVENQTHSDSVNYFCPLVQEYEGDDWIVEICDYVRALDDAGSLASVLIWVSTATGAWFLVVAYRSNGGVKQNLPLALLDSRFCLATGGLMVSSPLIWRVMINDVINGWERSLGAGFYITIVGGLLGIASYIMIERIHPVSSEMLAAEKARIHAENEAKVKAEADAKAEAETAAHDAELLRVTAEAVKAKVEAEDNPNDPLSWLRMAEAMDAANRHEEAERCRKTAMELMEKESR